MPLAVDADCRAVELLGDRWSELGDGDLAGLHAVDGDHGLGDTFGQAFEQLILGLAHDRGDALGDMAVVRGIGQVVGTAGIAEVDEQRQVDPHGLGDAAFVRQDPDDGRDNEPADLDRVMRGGHEIQPTGARRSDASWRRRRRCGTCPTMSPQSARRWSAG